MVNELNLAVVHFTHQNVHQNPMQICACAWIYRWTKNDGKSILVPRACDPSGLRQESRALGATISGMRHRCRLRETGWAEFGYFLCCFKMVAPRALDSGHRPKES